MSVKSVSQIVNPSAAGMVRTELKKLDVKRDAGTEGEWIYTLHIQSDIPRGQALEDVFPGAGAMVATVEAVEEGEGEQVRGKGKLNCNLKGYDESRFNVVVKAPGKNKAVCTGQGIVLKTGINVDSSKRFLHQSIRIFAPTPGILKVGSIMQFLHKELDFEVEPLQQELDLKAAK